MEAVPQNGANYHETDDDDDHEDDNDNGDNDDTDTLTCVQDEEEAREIEQWNACAKMMDIAEQETTREGRMRVLHERMPACIEVMRRLYDRDRLYPIGYQQVAEAGDELHEAKTRPPSLLRYLDLIERRPLDSVDDGDDDRTASAAALYDEDMCQTVAEDLAAWLRDFPAHAPWLQCVLDHDVESVARRLGGGHRLVSMYGVLLCVTKCMQQCGYDAAPLHERSLVPGYVASSATRPAVTSDYEVSCE